MLSLCVGQCQIRILNNHKLIIFKIFKLHLISSFQNFEDCKLIRRAFKENMKFIYFEYLITGVSHDTKQTRAELLSLVKLHQPKSKSYELDTIAQEKGHTVVRLPPYHNQYNPIEMVWAQVKSEVAERNITCQVADVEQLVNHVLDQTSREVWEQSVQHAEQLQENDFKKELYRDQHLESFVINLQSDSESDDEHHDDYYSDDDHDQHDGDPLTVHHDQHTLITGDTSTLHHDNNDNKNLFS